MQWSNWMKIVLVLVSGVVGGAAVGAEQDKPLWQWTPEEMKEHVKTARSGRDLTPAMARGSQGGGQHLV